MLRDIMPLVVVEYYVEGFHGASWDEQRRYGRFLPTNASSLALVSSRRRQEPIVLQGRVAKITQTGRIPLVHHPQTVHEYYNQRCAALE